MIHRLHALLLRIYRRLPVRGRRLVVRTIAPTYTVGAMCIIERADGAVLFVRHSYRRRWGTPGGLLKRGEEPADAARREVLEEVGLEVELIGEPAVVVDAEPQRIDIVYRARPAANATTDTLTSRSPEIVEFGWFPPDGLPELQSEAIGALMALARASRSPQSPPLVWPHTLDRLEGA